MYEITDLSKTRTRTLRERRGKISQHGKKNFKLLINFTTTTLTTASSRKVEGSDRSQRCVEQIGIHIHLRGRGGAHDITHNKKKRKDGRKIQRKLFQRKLFTSIEPSREPDDLSLSLSLTLTIARGLGYGIAACAKQR